MKCNFSNMYYYMKPNTDIRKGILTLSIVKGNENRFILEYDNARARNAHILYSRNKNNQYSKETKNIQFVTTTFACNSL